MGQRDATSNVHEGTAGVLSQIARLSVGTDAAEAGGGDGAESPAHEKREGGFGHFRLSLARLPVSFSDWSCVILVARKRKMPLSAQIRQPFQFEPKGRDAMLLQTYFDRRRLLSQGVILLRRCLPSNWVIGLHRAAAQMFNQRLTPDRSLPTAENQAEARRLSYVAVSDRIGAPPNFSLVNRRIVALAHAYLGHEPTIELNSYVRCMVRGQIFRSSRSIKIRRSYIDLCLTFGYLSTPAASLLLASK